MKRKFCPKCKSEDVEIKITATTVLGMPQNWRCNKCGYYNFTFPEKVNLSRKARQIKIKK